MQCRQSLDRKVLDMFKRGLAVVKPVQASHEANDREWNWMYEWAGLPRSCYAPSARLVLLVSSEPDGHGSLSWSVRVTYRDVPTQWTQESAQDNRDQDRVTGLVTLHEATKDKPHLWTVGVWSQPRLRHVRDPVVRDVIMAIKKALSTWNIRYTMSTQGYFARNGLTVDKVVRMQTALRNAAARRAARRVVLGANGQPVLDPISLNTIPVRHAIELNRQHYDARHLSRWVRDGHGTVPHSRRFLTASEAYAIRRLSGR